MLCCRAAAYRSVGKFVRGQGNSGDLAVGEVRFLENTELSALLALEHERPGEEPLRLPPQGRGAPLARRWGRGAPMSVTAERDRCSEKCRSAVRPARGRADGTIRSSRVDHRSARQRLACESGSIGPMRKSIALAWMPVTCHQIEAIDSHTFSECGECALPSHARASRRATRPSPRSRSHTPQRALRRQRLVRLAAGGQPAVQVEADPRSGADRCSAQLGAQPCRRAYTAPLASAGSARPSAAPAGSPRRAACDINGPRFTASSMCR